MSIPFEKETKNGKDSLLFIGLPFNLSLLSLVLQGNFNKNYITTKTEIFKYPTKK